MKIKRDRLEKRGHAAQLKMKAAIIKELREKGYQLKYLFREKSMQMARSSPYYFELSKCQIKLLLKHCLADEPKDIFLTVIKANYGVKSISELIKRGHKVNHMDTTAYAHLWGWQESAQLKSVPFLLGGRVGKVENILDRDFSDSSYVQNGLPMYLSLVFRGSVISLPYLT